MSVNKKSFIKNVLRIMTSRGVMLVSEVLLGFIIPKILGVTGYGYFKTYALYAAYAALLHFGFVDGILLRFAGKEYDQLDKKKMRAYSQFFIWMQVIVAILLLALCGTLLPKQLRFIAIMLAVNTFIINLTSYYQFISQATQRFKELSFRNILIAISKIVLVCGLLVLYQRTGNCVSYKYYIFFINVIELALLLWYIVTYKDITFGEKEKISNIKEEIWACMKNGFSLTIAYQVAHLVFMLDRQFVSILYNAEVFAIYSFAYSLVAVCTKIISTLSTVLFPMLKQMKEERAIQHFSYSISIMLILAGAILIGYFPLTCFIKWFLPAYEESLQYLRVILPALLLSCCISVLMFTFYKVINKNMVYFKTSCIIFGFSALANLFAHIVWGTPMAISWASVISMFVWYILAELYFVRCYKVTWKRNLGYISVISICFYLVSAMIFEWWKACLIYAVLFVLITMLFFRKMALIKNIKSL